jgi:hypothetical protein
MSGPSISSVAISIAITILLLAIAGGMTVGWVRGWQRLFHTAIAAYLKTLVRRIENLEANAADVRQTNDAFAIIMRRVARLEPMKEAEEFPPSRGGDHAAAMAGLRRARLESARQQPPTVGSVGRPSDAELIENPNPDEQADS